MTLAHKLETDIEFERLLNAIGVPMMILNRDLEFVYANDDYCRAVRKDKDEMLGRHIFDVFPDTPDRVAEVLKKFDGALAGDVTFLDEQNYMLEIEPGVWSERVWQAVQTPYRDDQGEVHYMIQRCDDITEQVDLRRQKEIVSGELDHRVRNMMAVVQAVANMTGQSSDTIEDFLQAYSGRLESMSRNFTQLSMGKWRGLPLQSILEDELAVFAEDMSTRVTLTGPPVNLSIKSTKDAALIIHELATNAAKYGALSKPSGKIEVNWSLEERSLLVEWAESGLSGIQTPEHEGFGFSFLKMMPNMKVEKDFRPYGLLIRFEIPVRIAVDSVEIA